MLEEKWGEFGPFEAKKQDLQAPASLVVTTDEKVIGGLVFSIYQKYDESMDGIWINGLIIKDDYRRRGIASSLIKRAVKCASNDNINELHVNTDIPTLYLNQGWQLIGTNGHDSVLKISVENPISNENKSGS
jgi:GNAT superfamily N-acetyltransferase